MNYAKTAIFLFFCILMQMSFLRLIAFFPAIIDLPFIFLFILSYRLPRFIFLFFAAFAGILIDLFSSQYFGASVLSLAAAFWACYFFRENFFKSKNFSDVFLCGAAVNLLFYIFLFFSDKIMSFAGGSGFAFNFWDKSMAIEVILSAAAAAFGLRFFEKKISSSSRFSAGYQSEYFLK